MNYISLLSKLPIGKVKNGSFASIAVAVAVQLLATFAGVQVPAAVADAAIIVIGFVASYITPLKRDELPPVL